MVIVTKSNFIEQSNDLLDHLQTAAFVAVDEEMTGISFHSNTNSGRRPSKDEPPHQQYQELKKVPETYSIIQLGISLFHYTGKTMPNSTSDPSSTVASQANPSDSAATRSRQPASGTPTSSDSADWTVRRYNFFAFPGKDSDRSVVLNPAAVAFLHQHNISFDKWTKEGIPFQTDAKAKETIQQYLKKQLTALAEKNKPQKKQPTVEEASRRKVQLRRTEDIDFFSRTMAGLRGWIDSPISPNEPDAPAEGASYKLPECNAFLRRALYESIEQEYPSLILEKVPNSFHIRVLRLSDEEKEQREARLQKEAWNNLIVEQVGLYRIFFALSQVARGFTLERDTPLLAASMDDIDWDKELSLYRGPKHRKVPIVVHNGFMDLCFMLSHFVMPKLPDTLSKCKNLILKLFPIIYDTKILALECSPIHFNDNTRLGLLYQRVKSQLEGGVRVISKPEVNNLQSTEVAGGTVSTGNDISPAGQDSADIAEEDHFADYDAFMTGVCFLGICQSILRNIDQSSEWSSLFGGHTARPSVGTLGHLLAPVDDPQVKKYFGRNMLYQMSMYNLDLEDSESDPLCRGMKKQSTFRVSCINSSTTTRDIVNCVSGLSDTSRRPVNFEIIWIDDTTFLVAAAASRNQRDRSSNSHRDNDDDGAMLEEHGSILENALKRRFQDAKILSLEDYLRNAESGADQCGKEDPFSSIANKLFNWIGIWSSDTSNESPSNKKRKIAS